MPCFQSPSSITARTVAPLSLATLALLASCSPGPGPEEERSVELTSSVASVAEGTSVDLVLRLSRELEEDLVLRVRPSGASSADVELAPEVSIPAGSMEATVELVVLDDGRYEGDEKVVLSVEKAGVSDVRFETSELEILLLDAQEPPAVSFDVGSSTAAEGESALALKVLSSVLSDLPVTARVAVAGGTAAPEDYLLTAEDVVIVPGESSATVTLTALDDGVDEGREDLVLTLVDIQGGQPGLRLQHTVEIDDPVRPTFPDGLVYTNVETGAGRGLYETDPAGSGTRRLVDAPDFGDVRQFEFSPDGEWIAMLADLNQDESVELSVVGRDGGAPIVLSVPLGSDEVRISDFAWAPSSDFIAYRITGLFLGDLFVTDLAGQNVQLDDRRTKASGIALDYAWSPSGSSERIAFLSSANLFTCTPLGQDLRCLTEDQGTLEFAWNAAGTHVAYIEALDRKHLAVSDAHGLEQRILTTGIRSTGDVERFWWSPTDDRLAFAGDYATWTEELFAVNATGGDVVELSDPNLTERVYEVAWSPDGQFVAYIAEEGSIEGEDVLLVRPDGTGRRLAASEVLDEGPGLLTWSPNSSALVFWRDDELIAAYADGSPERLLSSFYDVSVARFVWSHAGDRVLFRSDRNLGFETRLFAVSLTGEEPVQLSNEDVAPRLTSYRWSADDRYVAYRRSDARADRRLYLAESLLDSSGFEVSRDGERDVSAFVWRP